MPAISKAVNKDLKDERDKVKFIIDEFTNWFYGSAEKVADNRKIGMQEIERENERLWSITLIIVFFLPEKYFLSDKSLNLELDTSYLGYKEKYEEAVRRSCIVYTKMFKLHQEMGGTEEDFM